MSNAKDLQDFSPISTPKDITTILSSELFSQILDEFGFEQLADLYSLSRVNKFFYEIVNGDRAGWNRRLIDFGTLNHILDRCCDTKVRSTGFPQGLPSEPYHCNVENFLFMYLHYGEGTRPSYLPFPYGQHNVYTSIEPKVLSKDLNFCLNQLYNEGQTFPRDCHHHPLRCLQTDRLEVENHLNILKEGKIQIEWNRITDPYFSPHSSKGWKSDTLKRMIRINFSERVVRALDTVTVTDNRDQPRREELEELVLELSERQNSSSFQDRNPLMARFLTESVEIQKLYEAMKAPTLKPYLLIKLYHHYRALENVCEIFYNQFNLAKSLHNFLDLLFNSRGIAGRKLIVIHKNPPDSSSNWLDYFAQVGFEKAYQKFREEILMQYLIASEKCYSLNEVPCERCIDKIASDDGSKQWCDTCLENTRFMTFDQEVSCSLYLLLYILICGV